MPSCPKVAVYFLKDPVLKAHIVVAYPELNSYNAHLANLAKQTLEARGWGVTFSDLYAMGFDPCEKAADCADPSNPSRFDVQSEQRHASATTRFLPTCAPKLTDWPLLILSFCNIRCGGICRQRF
jgi:hypothetical protein